jgi:hypothetical protein
MADEGKARHKAQREQRLQAALRENLRRRKAQARGRAEDPSAAEPEREADPSAERGENRD